MDWYIGIAISSKFRVTNKKELVENALWKF